MEYQLINFCAPTLAGKKVSNLFTYVYESKEDLYKSVGAWKKKLKKLGIFIKILKILNNSALIYVYNANRLECLLEKRETRDFLSSYGYTYRTKEEVLDKLESRVKKTDVFPHEIGVLLGYPLKDVLGFIENRGKMCKFCGIWKVYDDVDKAKLMFGEYLTCKDCFLKLYQKGYSAEQIIKMYGGVKNE